MSQVRIPAWISVGVLPAVNILLAFLVSAILFYYLDINPVDAAEIMWYGAFGTGEGVGFTLYYATGFIFRPISAASGSVWSVCCSGTCCRSPCCCRSPS